MSTPFEIPEWLVAQSALPAPLPPVDDHRVEDLVNGFIAGKQDALFCTAAAIATQLAKRLRVPANCWALSDTATTRSK